MAALLPPVHAERGILARKYRENAPAGVNLSLRRRD
jgi:hypothetical protein